jgi:hypothetical protein
MDRESLPDLHYCCMVNQHFINAGQGGRRHPQQHGTKLFYQKLAVLKLHFSNSIWPKSNQFSSAIMVVIGDTFPSIPAAREAVNRWLLDEGLYYHVAKSKKSSVYELSCLAERGCTFHIKVWNTVAKGPKLTQLSLHTCFPDTHYDNKANLVIRSNISSFTIAPPSLIIDVSSSNRLSPRSSLPTVIELAISKPGMLRRFFSRRLTVKKVRAISSFGIIFNESN